MAGRSHPKTFQLICSLLTPSSVLPATRVSSCKGFLSCFVFTGIQTKNGRKRAILGTEKEKEKGSGCIYIVEQSTTVDSRLTSGNDRRGVYFTFYFHLKLGCSFFFVISFSTSHYFVPKKKKEEKFSTMCGQSNHVYHVDDASIVMYCVYCNCNVCCVCVSVSSSKQGRRLDTEERKKRRELRINGKCKSSED